MMDFLPLCSIHHIGCDTQLHWPFVCHGEYLTAKNYSSISRPLLVFELSLCGTGYIQIHLEALARIEVRWGAGP